MKDIGSGLNYRRKGLKALLGRLMSRDVSQIVVAHKDRRPRFGFELIEWYVKQNGCKVVVLDQSHLSPEREMVEDILAIVHVFSCRLYGLRKYKSAIKEDPSLPGNSTEA
ncbi:MAG: IS607 family transposase [Moorea sp. SIO4A3]|nr:IS607 family transposase [Moorena sp. SIO4A3]